MRVIGTNCKFLLRFKIDLSHCFNFCVELPKQSNQFEELMYPMKGSILDTEMKGISIFCSEVGKIGHLLSIVN